MKRQIRGVLVGAAMLLSGSAEAETYAAIAFSQTNGYFRYANRFDTQDGAEERALQECGESCEIVIWARDACAVLFVGAGNGYGVGWSADEGDAVRTAADECDARTTDCENEGGGLLRRLTSQARSLHPFVTRRSTPRN
jgi:serine/threonine-protein kinase